MLNNFRVPENRNLANGNIEFDIKEDGKGVYRKKGADTWLPFSSGKCIIGKLNEYKGPSQQGQKRYNWIPAEFNTDYFEPVSEGLKVKVPVTLQFNCACGIPAGSPSGTMSVFKNDAEIYNVYGAGDYYNLFTRFGPSGDFSFEKDDILKIYTDTNISVSNGGIYAYCQILQG